MATVNFIRNAKQSRGALSGVKKYVEQEEKTLDMRSGMRLISGQNCSPQFADKEFLATRDVYRKDSPRYFYHYTQSFHPDEPITGEIAHKIAKEFAARAWPESEVLIATHVDAKHIHSHFVVNAVCYNTGKMLRQSPNTLRELRKLSDEICQSHGLSVLPPEQTQTNNGVSAREYRSAAKGESWKFQLMSTIDNYMRLAKSKREFIELMQDAGYSVLWTDSRKNITYTTPTNKKCRDDRLHDKKYLKEMMEREFRLREEIIHGRAETVEYADGIDTDPGAEYTTTAAGMDPDPPGYGYDDADAVRTDATPGRNAPSRSYIFDSEAAGGDNGDAGTDTGSARTGWEKERASLLSAMASHSDAASEHLMAADPDGLGGLVDGVVQLGYSLERLADPGPVIDGTTRAPHIDRKRLRELQRRKIAHGHKEDDHEEKQTWQQTMQ